jgi:hypothetical protein
MQPLVQWYGLSRLLFPSSTYRIINRIADIFYQAVSGCMTAQVRFFQSVLSLNLVF